MIICDTIQNIVNFFIIHHAINEAYSIRLDKNKKLFKNTIFKSLLRGIKSLEGKKQLIFPSKNDVFLEISLFPAKFW